LDKHNLNAQAHETTIQLIQQVLDQGVNLTEIYVDTVGPPDSYQKKLSSNFPSINITVSKKADSKYPIVSAASICAKVTRDHILKKWKFIEKTIISTKFGSGYPSVKWLENNIRFSWATCEMILNKKAISVTWPENYPSQNNNLKQMFTKESNKTSYNKSKLFKDIGLSYVSEFQ
ncbi:19487_t:CDS:2, partial [Entrophospora sp. SA101]